MTHILITAAQHSRRIIRSGIAGILAVTALSSAIACSGGDSSTGPRNRDPSGTYALLQVDKKKIPSVIFRGPYTLPSGASYDPFVFTITGGELILQSDGELHAAIDYRAAAAGDELTGTRADDGTYEIQGDKIRISSNGGANIGSYRNGIITLELDAMGNGEPRTFTFRYVP